jgi:transcriptional regulator with XRE-family HTH domain
MITPQQIRGARAMLGLTQAELAKRAGISTTGLNNIESGTGDPKASTLTAIKSALEAAGIEFTNGEAPGIRMKADQTYGFVHGAQRCIGMVKNGEFRLDSPRRELIALVNGRNLHDPETGEFIASLGDLGAAPDALPERFRSRLQKVLN